MRYDNGKCQKTPMNIKVYERWRYSELQPCSMKIIRILHRVQDKTVAQDKSADSADFNVRDAVGPGAYTIREGDVVFQYVRYAKDVGLRLKMYVNTRINMDGLEGILIYWVSENGGMPPGNTVDRMTGIFSPVLILVDSVTLRRTLRNARHHRNNDEGAARRHLRTHSSRSGKTGQRICNFDSTTLLRITVRGHVYSAGCVISFEILTSSFRLLVRFYSIIRFTTPNRVISVLQKSNTENDMK